MDEMIKTFSEKISSYNIFNNLFPGIIFTFVINRTTRFNIGTESLFENVFIYYFIGMVISRVGSIFIEKLLKKIKIKNKKTKKKEPFLNFANYNDFVNASEKQEDIKTLSETNNTYRTLIALFFLLATVKIYDMFIHTLLIQFVSKNVICVTLFILLSILFVYSYRKQTSYISKRVKKFKEENEGRK